MNLSTKTAGKRQFHDQKDVRIYEQELLLQDLSKSLEAAEANLTTVLQNLDLKTQEHEHYQTKTLLKWTRSSIQCMQKRAVQ